MTPKSRPRKQPKKPAAALPVVPTTPARPASTPRRSRTAKWRAGVLIAVHVLIGVHIAHWLISGSTVTPVEPSEAIAFSRGGMVNAGLIFFAAAILATAVFGRFFCGWACHLVALQDLCRWLLLKVGIRPRPLRSRLLAWVPAIACVYMFLWPAAYRLWIGDGLGVRGTEMTTEHFWSTFPGWTVGILTFLVCGFASVYFLGAKGFCTYACPYGAAFSVAERVAPVRVRVTEACEGCAHCTASCSSNVRVHEEVATWGMVTDPGCMRTGDCVSVCPNDALYFGFGRLPLGARRRQEPRERRPALGTGEELVAGMAFLATFLAFRGLFGAIPFLMSLGLAGVLAYLALLGFRLARRRDLAFRHRRLKSAGQLTAGGRLLVAGLIVLALATGWAGALRATAALGDLDYARTAEARIRLLDVSAPLPPLTEEERIAVDDSRRRWEAVRRWSPLPWLGAASRLAALRYLDGNPDGFRAAAREAVERGERSWEVSRLEAREAAETGNLAGAMAAGERAIALEPGRPVSYSSLGILLARAGALDAGAEVLARGLARFPASIELTYDAGLVSAYRGQPQAAIALFERVLRLDPEHTEAQENLAGMLASVGRYDEAAARYRRALERAPEDLDLRLLLARALSESGRAAEARAELESLLALAPGHLAARELLERLGGSDPGGEENRL